MAWGLGPANSCKWQSQVADGLKNMDENIEKEGGGTKEEYNNTSEAFIAEIM